MRKRLLQMNHVRIPHLPLSSLECGSELVPDQDSCFSVASPQLFLPVNKAWMITQIWGQSREPQECRLYPGPGAARASASVHTLLGILARRSEGNCFRCKRSLPSLVFNQPCQTFSSVLVLRKGTGLNSYQDCHRTNESVWK